MASAAHHSDDLFAHKTDGVPIAVFIGRIVRHLTLTKGYTFRQLIDDIRRTNTVPLLESALKYKQDVLRIKRAPYDPFVGAIRRRALRQLGHDPECIHSPWRSDEATTSQHAKDNTRTPSRGSATSYACSRLDEERKRQGGETLDQAEQKAESLLRTKIVDVAAFYTLSAEGRILAEGLMLECLRRKQFEQAALEDTRRWKTEILGESSSSGVGNNGVAITGPQVRL